MIEREKMLRFKVVALRNLLFKTVGIAPTENDIDELDKAATMFVFPDGTEI
ncbi:MAG: hypothetical protein LBU31_00820 [Coriobacteriales bacterium]|jgi:hypothetical protein|nr:hypothetical protein [Coriobacteriales bacterium]